MPIRYYPPSKIKPNKKTSGGEFILNGEFYIGQYYETFDGQFFTGANPIIGKNERLVKAKEYLGSGGINGEIVPKSIKDNYNRNKRPTNRLSEPIESFSGKALNLSSPNFKGQPTAYFPIILDQDYVKGYINRYFIKRTNSKGYITEISQNEYAAVQSGNVPYDVSFWHAIKIQWKLTGPLNAKRISQYHTRAGIIDTNKRLVEEANKTFVGMVDYIGGQYDKFAKPTE